MSGEGILKRDRAIGSQNAQIPPTEDKKTTQKSLIAVTRSGAIAPKIAFLRTGKQEEITAVLVKSSNASMVWQWNVDFSLTDFDVVISLPQESSVVTRFSANSDRIQCLFGVKTSETGEFVSDLEVFIEVLLLSIRDADVFDKEFEKMHHEICASLSKSESLPEETFVQYLSDLISTMKAPLSPAVSFRLLSLCEVSSNSHPLLYSQTVIQQITTDLTELLGSTAAIVRSYSMSAIERLRGDIDPGLWETAQHTFELLAKRQRFESATSAYRRKSATSWLRSAQSLTELVEFSCFELRYSNCESAAKDFQAEVNLITSAFIDEDNCDPTDAIAIFRRIPYRIQQILLQTSLKFLITEDKPSLFPRDSKSTRISVYFIYSLTKEELKNVEMIIASDSGSIKADLIEQFAPSNQSRAITLWRGEHLQIEGRDIRFEILMKLKSGVTLTENYASIQRNRIKVQNEMYVFFLSFRAYSHVRTIGQPICNNFSHIEVYLGHIMKKPNCFHIVSDLLRPIILSFDLFHSNEIGTNIDMKRIRANRDVIFDSDFLMCCIYMLGGFPILNEEICQYWVTFLTDVLLIANKLDSKWFQSLSESSFNVICIGFVRLVQLNIINRHSKLQLKHPLGHFYDIIAKVFNISEDFLKYLEHSSKIRQITGLNPGQLGSFTLLRAIITAIEDNMYVSQIFDTISVLLKKKQLKSLKSILDECEANWSALLNFERKVCFIDEKTIGVIKAILSLSEVSFIDENSEMTLEVTFQHRKTAFRSCFSDIAKINQYCQYASTMLGAESNEDITVITKSFLSFSNTLFRTLTALCTMQAVGASTFPSNSLKFRIENADCSSIEELNGKITRNIDTWKSIISEIQQISYPLTYVFGPHLWTLEKAIFKPKAATKLEMSEATSMLNLMNLRIVDKKQLRQNAEKPDLHLLALRDFLETLKQPKSPTARPSSQNRSNVSLALDDFLFIESSDAAESLLSVFFNHGEKFPKSHQVMICRIDTLICELQAFILHCLTRRSGKSKLFALVNCELLSSDAQKEGIQLVKYQIEHYKSISKLVVISQNSKCNFAQFLIGELQQTRVRIIPKAIQKFDVPYVRGVNPRLFVLTSDKPGLGKTKWLEHKTVYARLQLSIVHIAGNLNYNAFVESLCSLNLSENSVLLVQIGFVSPDSYALLAEVIMQIALLKGMKSNLHFFVLPGCDLFFEVENTQTKDWVVNSTVLRYFPVKNVNEIDLSALLHTDTIQTALTYLDAFASNSIKLYGKIVTSNLIDINICEKLIRDYFMSKREETASFRSIRTFLYQLGSQITCLNQSQLSFEHWIDIDMDLSLRIRILESLIANCVIYATISLSEVTKMQKIALKNEEIISDAKNSKVSWESFNTDIIVFNDRFDYNLISKNVNSLLNVIYCYKQTDYKASIRSGIRLPDYGNMNSNQLLECLRGFYCPRNFVSDSGYVITPDNFLKMQLIYTRIQAGISVILIGETGCGKTSLLKFLIDTLLQEKLEEVFVNATTSANQISEQLTEIANRRSNEKRIFVLFDDCNATVNVGNLSELICDRRLNGKRLPDNFVIFATCRPYRLRANSQTALEVPPQIESSLEYRVNPLPESMIDFVWDFGAISGIDLHRYIFAILVKGEIPSADKYATLVFIAHEYVSQKEGPSSASLRNVKRFVLLFRWFVSLANLKSQVPDSQEYHVNSIIYDFDLQDNPLSTEDSAALIAIYMSYIVRISNKVNRLESMARMSFLQQKLSLPASFLPLMIESYINDFFCRLSLTSVTANDSMKEMLFVTLNSIFAKVPVIVTGEPGCGKSFAMKILSKCCAKDKLFQKLPSMEFIYIQCHESLAKDTLAASFEKARKINRLNEGKKIAIIVLDDLHECKTGDFDALSRESEMSIENNLQSVVFVGISSERLDAALENKAVKLSVPPTDEIRVLENGVSRLRQLTYFEVAEGLCETSRYDPPKDALSELKASLTNRDKRALIVVGEEAVIRFALQKHAAAINQELVFLLGSELSEDLDSETYARCCLLDIIRLMGRKTLLILRNMSQVCAALSDMQSQKWGKKKYGKHCNVTLGDFFVPGCYVNDDFRLIILDDGNHDLKHARIRLNTVDFPGDALLSKKELSIISRLQSWVASFTAAIHISEFYLFPIYSPVWLQISVLQSSHEPEESIISKLKRELISVAPADIAILAEMKGPGERATQGIWMNTHTKTLEETIKGVIRSDSGKLFLLFAYDLDESVPTTEMDRSAIFQYLRNVTSEDRLQQEYSTYIEQKEATAYFLILNYATEKHQIAYIKHSFESVCSSKSAFQGNKKLCLLISMQRSCDYIPLSLEFSKWTLASVDNLSSNSFTVADVLANLSPSRMITALNIVSIENSLETLFAEAVSRLASQPGSIFTDKEGIVQLTCFFRTNILKHAILADTFKRKIIRLLDESEQPLHTAWNHIIFSDEMCIKRSRNLITAIRNALKSSSLNCLVSIVKFIEKHAALRSFFSLWTKPEGHIVREIWANCVITLNCDLQRNARTANCQYLLDFPFSLLEYELLKDAYSDIPAFTNRFASSTVTKDYISRIESSEKLQQTYFSDLIQIHINSCELPKDTNDLLYFLLWPMLMNNPSFLSQAWIFNQNLQFATQFCWCVVRFAGYFSTSIENLYSTFIPKEALSCTRYIHKFEPDLPFLSSNSDEANCKDQPKAMDSFDTNTTVACLWRKRYVQILNSSILLLIPTTASEHRTDLRDNRRRLKLLEREISEINEQFANVRLIQFLNSFPTVGNSNSELEFFLNLCEFIKSTAPIDDSEFAPFAPKTINGVFKRINQLQNDDLEVALVYKAYYYALLIQESAEYIERFSSELTQFHDLWKSSAVVIDTIVRLADIDKRCSELFLTGFEGKMSENQYALALETILKQEESQHGSIKALISDRCFSLFASQTPLSEKSFLAYFSQFKLCFQSILEETLNFPHTNRLISISFVKWYLTLYCWLLADSTNCTDKSKVIRDLVAECLGNRRAYPEATLRIYCLKRLFGIFNREKEKLAQFLSRKSKVLWVKDVLKLIEDDEKNVCFIKVDNKEIFDGLLSCFYWLTKTQIIEETEAKFDQILSSITDADGRANFGLAFLSHIVSNRSAASLRLIVTLIKKKKDAMTEQLGSLLTALLCAILSNFTPESHLRIPDNCSETEKHHKIVIHALLIVITACSKMPGCLTSIFFDTQTGKVSPIALQSMYVVGAVHSPLYEYLYCLQENPTKYKEDLWFACGNCDYIYPLPECPELWVQKLCPYCGLAIEGDKANGITKRAGHREISEAETVTLAAQHVGKYMKRMQQRGMKDFETTFESAGLRGISTLTYILLNYFVNWCLYYLFTIEPGIVQRAICLTRYRSLEDYFRKTLDHGRRLLDININHPESYLFLYKIVSNLPKLLKSNLAIPEIPQVRLEFEQTFYRSFIETDSRNIVEAMNDYKASVPRLMVPIYEENESQLREYPKMSQFRLTREASLELLISTWNLNPLPDDYPILNFFIRKLDYFHLLRCLLPLVRLTNYLTEQYSHKIKRNDASYQPMQFYIEKDTALDRLFSDFISLWNSFSFDLRFGCHLLPSKSFEKSNEIHYFLIDDFDDSRGMYMLAALETLSKKQNDMLTLLSELIVANHGRKASFFTEKSMVSIQEVQPEQILSFCLEDMCLLQGCWTSNPSYGKGEEISFDYHLIELKLEKYTEKVCLLSVANMRFFTFQFELLSIRSQHSTLIADIRNSIMQTQLSESECKAIKEAIYSRLHYQSFVSDLHTELEFAMCAMRNPKVSSYATIQAMCCDLGVESHCETIRTTDDISILPPTSIVSLYELLEDLLFPLYTPCIRKQYLETDASGSTERAVKAMMELGTTGIESAVKRFILRCLSMELSPEESLGTYISREDFWDQSVSAQQREAIERHLEATPIRYSMHVLRLIRGEACEEDAKEENKSPQQTYRKKEVTKFEIIKEESNSEGVRTKQDSACELF